jgi:hypothetical protein
MSVSTIHICIFQSSLRLLEKVQFCEKNLLQWKKSPRQSRLKFRTSTSARGSQNKVIQIGSSVKVVLKRRGEEEIVHILIGLR